MSKQQEYNKRWAQENKEHNRKLKYRSTARTFIRNHAELEDLKELRGMLNKRESELKIEEIQSWLHEYGTVEKYDQFKSQPELLENAQPIDFVSFYYTTLNDEIENNEFEETPEELAEIFNLDEAKPNETFIQLNAIDWADSTNATAFYLSDVESKEKFMQYVNEALEIDQVTHSSGLKPKYQFV